MLAIPVFRSRVAPVLNWCSKVLLFPEDTQDNSSCEEVTLGDIPDPYERLRVLQKKGVTTLVCGALSPELLHYAEDLELKVICGVAGGVSDVLEAYGSRKLDQPCFRLPGCHCMQRYGAAERRPMMPGRQGTGCGQGRGKGRGNAQGGTGQMGGRSTGPVGECVCPKCGTVAIHERGAPCTQMTCPNCGQQMIRK